MRKVRGSVGLQQHKVRNKFRENRSVGLNFELGNKQETWRFRKNLSK
jgi:hypothetical protein